MNPADDPTVSLPRDSAAAASPRVWPAAAILLAYIFTAAGMLLSPTIIINALGSMAAPAVTTLLLVLWWLSFSRVSWRERFAGLGLFSATLAWIGLGQPKGGAVILFVALPILFSSLVVVMLSTARFSARLRRSACCTVLLIAAIVFPMFRVADVSSSFMPMLAWRWTPTSEETLAASASAPPIRGKAEVPAEAGPLDWPGFRGPQRNGILSGVRFATDWSSAPPKELWRKPVGLGYSSFTVVGDFVFTQEQRLDQEVVSCYRAATGEEIWENRVAARFEDATGHGPRATPTFENGRLYTQGALGMLQCLDASTGDVLWKTDLRGEHGAPRPQWGFASSPLLTAGHAIVFAGGKDGSAVMAFDKATGQRAWAGGNGSKGYASAQLSTVDGVPQILMASSYGVQGLDPDTGTLLWENQWPVEMNPRVVQPLLFDGNTVLLGTAQGKGTRSLKLAKADDGWKVQEQWTSKAFRPYFNDFVFHKGFCYGFDGDTFMCFDAATGERRWKGSKFGGQVLLLEDMELLLVLSEKGEVILVRATPEVFEETARFKALSGKTWNHPVVAQGKLFVRNAEEMACYALAMQ